MRTLQYISNNAVASLERNLSVRIRYIPQRTTPPNTNNNNNNTSSTTAAPTTSVMSLHYIPEEAPLYCRIVRECCGLVRLVSAETSNNNNNNTIENNNNNNKFQILSYPFSKISYSPYVVSSRLRETLPPPTSTLNYTAPSTTIPKPVSNNASSSIRVFEKLDGVLVTMYWLEDQWTVEIGSSSIHYDKYKKNPREIKKSNTNMKRSDLPLPLAFYKNTLDNEYLEDLFWDIWKEKKYELPYHPQLQQEQEQQEHPEERKRRYCYMFEMCSNSCRNIVIHPEDRIGMFLSVSLNL